MVGARRAERLRRRLVDLRSVAEHHREHEAALGARGHVPFDRGPRPVAQRAPRLDARDRPCPAPAPPRGAPTCSSREPRRRRARRRVPRHAGCAQSARRCPSASSGRGVSPPISTRTRPARRLDSSVAVDRLDVERGREPAVTLERSPRTVPSSRSVSAPSRVAAAPSRAGRSSRRRLAPSNCSDSSARRPHQAPRAAAATASADAPGAREIHARASRSAASASSSAASSGRPARPPSRQPPPNSAAVASSGRLTAGSVEGGGGP